MHCLGDYGRANVHRIDLAHGNHLRRPILFFPLPTSLPAHEVSGLRRRKDRLRLDRLDRYMLVPGICGAS